MRRRLYKTHLLNVVLFSKDLKKCYKGPRKSNFFIVVSRLDGDKLCYRDTILKKDLNRLKN